MENVKEEKVPTKIDWNEFTSEYVSLPEGDQKELTLTNWEQIQKEFEGKPRSGIKMFCVKEDDNSYSDKPKVFSTFSKRLIMLLKPYIVNAEKLGNKTITVKITRVGTGTDTRYTVK